MQVLGDREVRGTIGGVDRAASRWRSQRGAIGLTELLVVIAIAIPVLAAVTSFGVLAIRSEARTASRATTIGKSRTGLDRMMRELRQASSITQTSSTSIRALVGGLTVDYVCRPDDATLEARGCYRDDFDGNPAELVLGGGETRLLNSDVFTLGGGGYLEAKVVLRDPHDPQLPSTSSVTIQDGVLPRNGSAG